ncbi:MAG: tetratricopeptide repeat protein [Chitinophagaceae bacterium]
MKKITATLLLLACLTAAHSQRQVIDSLNRMLTAAKDDTTRANILIDVGRYYSFSKPDSGLLLVHQGLELSRRAGYLKGQANGLNMEGIIYYKTGNYPRALSSLLSALQINEKRKDQLSIAKNLGNIAGIYADQGDYRQHINLLLRVRAIAEQIGHDRVLQTALSNLGTAYLTTNKLDSARIYTQQGYELASKLNDLDALGNSTSNLGWIQLKMNNPGIALEYYRLAIPYYEQVDDKEGIAQTSLAMAELFKKGGQPDSALYYARRSVLTSDEAGFTSKLLDASAFLAAYFREKKQIDSAFHYQEIVLVAKDSLFSQEKVREVQNLSFAESIRQQEIAEQKRKEDKAYQKNLQLAGIGIFLPVFFFALLFLSRRRVKPKTINFLSILMLLLTFEFIVMLMRPAIIYLVQLAREAPAVVIFINIGIGSALVPLHRWLEKWVKSKLAGRSKKEAPAAPVES